MPRAELIAKFGHTFKSFNSGVDLGNGSSETSSATAMVSTAIGKTGSNFILDCYYSHNKDGYVSNKQHANKMVNTILDLVKQYPHLRQLVNSNGFVFRCEWDFSFIEMLDEAIIGRNVDEFMETRQAHKHNELARIEIRKYLIGSKKYYVAKEAINHLEELELQRWDETKKDNKTGRHKPEDANNHTTDAQDYSVDEEA